MGFEWGCNNLQRWNQSLPDSAMDLEHVSEPILSFAVLALRLKNESPERQPWTNISTRELNPDLEYQH